MATPAQNTTVQATATTTQTGLLPSPKTLLQAAKIAIEQDRAIMLDYYCDTANKTAFIAEDDVTKQRVLAKSKEEFTSLISKLYKVDDDIIILTENSIYIVAACIQKRKVDLARLQEAHDA